jgi:hypothetical protein
MEVLKKYSIPVPARVFLITKKSPQYYNQSGNV